ncbi:MAG: lamin tail domain-containing protein, partial [Chloroflexi bacterium]|nr:lamin tail domain-containing protein [Chloroflexota bacterium]
FASADSGDLRYRPRLVITYRRVPPPTATRTATRTATPTNTTSQTLTPTVPGTGQVRVSPSCCQFDAPGNDNDNLTEEYICLENHSGSSMDMTGWHVRDKAGATYTFPTYILPAAAQVRLHTGAGSNTATDLYWNRAAAVWNNDHDTVLLYDENWILVDAYSY